MFTVRNFGSHIVGLTFAAGQMDCPEPPGDTGVVLPAHQRKLSSEREIDRERKICVGVGVGGGGGQRISELHCGNAI